jgi:hypothetical protein
MRLGEVHIEETHDERRRRKVSRPSGVQDVEESCVRGAFGKGVARKRGRLREEIWHRGGVVEKAGTRGEGQERRIGVRQTGAGEVSLVGGERRSWPRRVLVLATRLEEDVEVIATAAVVGNLGGASSWVVGVRVEEVGTRDAVGG